MKEIEKKFLVNKLPIDLKKYASDKIVQGYLNTKSEPVLRVRAKNDKYFLTYKSSSSDLKSLDYNICDEYELPISLETFEHLKKKIDGNLIIKNRYNIKLDNNLTAELDVFDNQLKGLILVEVEFKKEEDIKNFVKPDWFGKDVSKNKKYRNSFLSTLSSIEEINDKNN